MTRAEAFDKAWRLGIKGDFSLVDEIYHPDYKAVDAYSGVEVNLEACLLYTSPSPRDA